MRRVLITTKRPGLFRGYMIVGETEDKRTRLRYEHKAIDSPGKRREYMDHLLGIDPFASVEISEVRS